MAIAGGVLGIIMGLLAMTVGGVSSSLEEGSGDELIALGTAGVATAVIAILAGALYFGGKREGWMIGLLVAATIGHVIAISAFAIPGAIFMLIAVLLAFFGRTKGPRQKQASNPRKACRGADGLLS